MSGVERMRTGWMALLASAVLVASCSGDAGATSVPEPASTSTSATSTSAESTTMSTIAESTTSTESATTTLPPESTSTTGYEQRESFLRRCGSRIGTGYGGLDESKILRIGPLALLDMDFSWTSDLPEFYYTPGAHGGHSAIKYVTVISEEAVGPVALEVAEGDRLVAGLVYDLSRQTPLPLSGTDGTVVFEGCAGADTQFNGGILVTEPVCLHLIVTDTGRPDSEQWTSAIPFGVAPEECA